MARQLTGADKYKLQPKIHFFVQIERLRRRRNIREDEKPIQSDRQSDDSIYDEPYPERCRFVME